MANPVTLSATCGATLPARGSASNHQRHAEIPAVPVHGSQQRAPCSTTNCSWSADGAADGLLLELAQDRELLDDPDGPFGNKGGLYIESRIESTPAVVYRSSSAGALRVTSPTITTPLAGVPEPFLASHYMKCLCPVGGALVGVELVE